MAQLINIASVTGSYQSQSISDSAEARVELSALSISKTADKQLWLDNSMLTYTCQVRNIDTGTPGEPVSGIVFTDIIDPVIAELDVNSVTVNGVPKVIGLDFTYDYATGLLTIDPLADLAPGGAVEISFRVTKKQP